MRRARWQEWLASGPSVVWLTALFAIPTLLVLAISFKPTNPSGGLGEGWTLDTWRSLANPVYPAIVWRTIWISVATTVACIAIGLPVAYAIARMPPSRRNWAMLLIILPFWTNFLIRIYAWKNLLHPDGFVQSVLSFVGIVSENQPLLYNVWAVLLVLVYSYLPFAILPLYAAAEKFDFALLDAARDLGATRWRAFFSVFVPGISKGLMSAVAIVLIPALGSFAIPDIVGGPDSEMIGNKIAQRVFADRNLPHASALSSVLALAIFAPMLIAQFRRKRGPRKELAA